FDHFTFAVYVDGNTKPAGFIRVEADGIAEHDGKMLLDLAAGPHRIRLAWVNPMPQAGLFISEVSLADAGYLRSADLDADNRITVNDQGVYQTTVSRSDFAQEITLAGKNYLIQASAAGLKLVKDSTKEYAVDADARGVMIGSKHYLLSRDWASGKLQLSEDHPADLNRDGRINEIDELIFDKAETALQKNIKGSAITFNGYEISTVTEGGLISGGSEVSDYGTMMLGENETFFGPSLQFEENITEAGEYRIGLSLRSASHEFLPNWQGWELGGGHTRTFTVDGTVRIEEGIAVSETAAVLSLNNLSVKAIENEIMTARLKVSGGATGKVYWMRTTDADYSETRSFDFALIADGNFHEYNLALGENDLWDGTIKAIKFVPSEEKALVEIEGIGLGNGQAQKFSWGNYAAQTAGKFRYHVFVDDVDQGVFEVNWDKQNFQEGFAKVQLEAGAHTIRIMEENIYAQTYQPGSAKFQSEVKHAFIRSKKMRAVILNYLPQRQGLPYFKLMRAAVSSSTALFIRLPLTD
ncbi:MAG: hypothetical protein HYZ84_00800, partial [Candidatus Omnitrophica bacterium]|nr:hypothetical protein [Candidatus Omnitrophota bacterium]